MELRHLRYIIAVADELNFGRAAIRLHISQPPLSQQIRQLEEELGVQVFYRTKRHVELSPAGAVVVEEARRIVGQCDHLKKVAKETARGQVGRLSIATMRIERAVAIEALHDFSALNPGVTTELICLETSDQLEALHSGRIDVGFVRLPLNDSAFEAEVVQRTPMVIGLPIGHPLSSHRQISFKDLDKQPFIMLKRSPLNHQYHDEIVRSWQAMGVEPQIVQEVTEPFAALSLVEAGIGITILPESVRELHPDGVVLRKLNCPHLKADCGVVYTRGSRCSVLNAFLQTVRDVVHKKYPQLPHGSVETPTSAR